MSSLHRLVARSVPSLVARCTHALVRARVIPTIAVQYRFASYRAPQQPTRPTKFTTKIAGLDVVPNGREVFIGLQKEILASIAEYNQKLGFEPACNDYARRLATHRLKIAEEEDDVTEIEKRLWSGQIEELIEQAENELDCVVLMNEEVKPWEKPSEEQLTQFQTLASPNFGQDTEQWKSGKPPVLTKEEQALVDEFWKPIDEEIRKDQEREAEERRLRKARK